MLWNGDLWFDVVDDGNNNNTKKYNDNHKDNQKENHKGNPEDFFSGLFGYYVYTLRSSVVSSKPNFTKVFETLHPKTSLSYCFAITLYIKTLREWFRNNIKKAYYTLFMVRRPFPPSPTRYQQN